MGTRIELQNLLESTLGSSNVYFNPPSNIQMGYPCIVYQVDAYNAKYGDNAPYALKRGYQVTLVTKDPDDPAIDGLAKLQLCSYQTQFTVDNLIHHQYRLYY